MTATDGDGDLEADLPPTSSSASTAIAAVATNTPKLLRFVRFIESVQVPWSSSRTKNDGKGSSNDVQPVFIIAGLERVIGSSSTSRRKAAADAVSICGVYPPRYLFYMVSGFLCDIIQFVSIIHGVIALCLCFASSRLLYLKRTTNLPISYQRLFCYPAMLLF